MAYVRTVNISSGAIGVQIVWSARRGSRQIEHLGSAHDDREVEARHKTVYDEHTAWAHRTPAAA